MSSNIATEPTSVDLGEGWRLLEIGERLKPGDGYLHPDYGMWIDYDCRPDMFRGGTEFAHILPWRRKVESPSVSMETKTEPAFGKFKMSIFENLLNAGQEAANSLVNSNPIGSAEYERGIRLQLAIERAAK